tara:strand:- start:1054 stop:1401 length:348 start_codon:yes stop_codon:yes gene_type:complete
MIFCFDIDNTICTTKGKAYKTAKPKKGIIKLINELYDSGHTIKIFTSRYMGRNRDNVRKARLQGYGQTLGQLKKWGLKFHKLLMGKPSYDIFVDDKALGYNKKLTKTLNKYISKK